MDCRKYKQSLSEAAVGALAPERQAALDRHLDNCPACAAQLARRKNAMAAIDTALLEVSRIEPSPNLLAHVQRDLALHAAARTRLRFASGVTAAAAVAALALLAAWAVRARFSVSHKSAPATASAIAPASEATPTLNPQARASGPVIENLPPVRHRTRAKRVPSEKSGLDPHFLALVKVQPESVAVRRLYRLLQSGRVAPQSLLATTPGGAGPEPIVPLEIKFLVFRPLEMSGEPASGQASPPSATVQRPFSGSDPRR